LRSQFEAFILSTAQPGIRVSQSGAPSARTYNPVEVNEKHMPLNIHPLFLVVLLAIVLIIFGPGKLPELGGAIGRGIKEFRKATTELTDEVKNAASEKKDDTPVAATETKVETEKKS